MEKYEMIVPVMWETHVDGYEYGYGGSGFYVKKKGIVFFVTAGHVVSGGVLDDLLIPANLESRDFLPLSEYIKPIECKIGDEKYKDLAIFKVADDKLDCSIVFPKDIVKEDVLESEDLYVVGYPNLNQKIDYDVKNIKRFRKAYSAKYITKINDVRSRISVDFDDGESLDGVSGGVVFRKKDHCICGMMIESSECGLSEYYDVRLIDLILEKITDSV